MACNYQPCRIHPHLTPGLSTPDALSPTRFYLKRHNTSCLGQMWPWVLQQIFCSYEHTPRCKKLIALWHVAGLPETLTPLSAGRTSKLWAGGKFSLFQARETSVLPKWILVFRNALGYYKYNLSEVWVCVRKRQKWSECVCACVCVMTERGASKGPVDQCQEHKAKQREYPLCAQWLNSGFSTASSLKKWGKGN